MTATADAPTDSAVAEFDLDNLLDNVPDPTADALRAVWGHLQAENEALRDRVDELEGELDNQSQNVSGAFAKLSANEDRLIDLEAHQATADPSDESTIDVDAARGGHDESTDDHSQTETPLETICSLPEHLAERELTTNQERARFIAQDVRDYAKKVPAGLVVDSSTIRKVVKAKEGTRPHTQTIARVMEFLDDFGKDSVETVKRRGKRRVVFDEDAARRYHTCCDRGHATDPPTAVMTPG